MVDSGIPDSPEWDGMYDVKTRGWEMFFYGLRVYLEKHRGEHRRNIVEMRPISGALLQAWVKITGPEGLAASGSFAGAMAGTRYPVTTSLRRRSSGGGVINLPPKNLSIIIEVLHDALGSTTFDETGGVTYIYFTLAPYGMNAQADEELRELNRIASPALYRFLIRRSQKGEQMTTLRIAISSALVLGIAASYALSQEKTSEADKAKIAAYMQLSKPGPEHQQLESLVGAWDQEIKFWMEPGKPPMTFKGTCQNRMILGGRFLVSEVKGGTGPTAFENMIIMGFDRRTRKFTTVEFDSEGTYYVAAAGPYDESRKAIVMYGEEVDPALGTQKYDRVMRIVSPTKYIIEVVLKDPAHTHGLPEFKMVEITLTKK
jgi:hypothetical protein